MLCPYYYCLYSLVNKIRDKGKISAWKRGGRREREGVRGNGGGRG
jgi:hypothetical protein